MNTPFEQARGHFLQGLAHLQAGRPAEAEAALLASLALMPGRPSSLINLAVARLALGRAAQAIDDLQAALQNEPDNVIAWSHLGEARLALGQTEQAVAAFNEAWKRGPATPALRFHRAHAQAAAQQAQPAWDTVQPLLQAGDVSTAPAWQLAGQILQMLGQHDDAERHYGQALALDPELGRCWLLLGQLHHRQRRPAAARQALEHAQRLGEDAALVAYLLAALSPPESGGDAAASAPAGAAVDAPVSANFAALAAAQGATPAATVPPISPVAYVRGLFDPYAEGFDEHLVNTLHYRGHTAVAQAALEEPRATWRSVLDLGCGTGLCGSLLRPRAQQLAGLDISPTMIEHTRRRGGYDQLHTDDVAQHLQTTNARYDLILAADVFIYIGDLNPVLAGVRRVLEPDGRFIFSIEQDDAADDELGFRLRPSLRYAHAPAGIAQRAARVGLVVDRVVPVVLREEEGQPIAGAVLVLKPLA